jgi:hypothetical protein
MITCEDIRVSTHTHTHTHTQNCPYSKTRESRVDFLKPAYLHGCFTTAPQRLLKKVNSFLLDPPLGVRVSILSASLTS